VHDGIGVWLAARRLNAGRFVWQLYEVERTATNADSRARLEARQVAWPVAEAFHQWLRQQRSACRMAQPPPGPSTTASSAGQH